MEKKSVSFPMKKEFVYNFESVCDITETKNNPELKGVHLKKSGKASKETIDRIRALVVSRRGSKPRMHSNMAPSVLTKDCRLNIVDSDGNVIPDDVLKTLRG